MSSDANARASETHPLLQSVSDLSAFGIGNPPLLGDPDALLTIFGRTKSGLLSTLMNGLPAVALVALMPMR